MTPHLRGRLSTLGLAVGCLATVGWVWWIEADPARDPTPDRAVETAPARRIRMQGALDHEVRVDAVDEPLGALIARLCHAAGVRVDVVRPQLSGDTPAGSVRRFPEPAEPDPREEL